MKSDMSFQLVAKLVTLNGTMTADVRYSEVAKLLVVIWGTSGPRQHFSMKPFLTVTVDVMHTWNIGVLVCNTRQRETSLHSSIKKLSVHVFDKYVHISQWLSHF